MTGLFNRRGLHLALRKEGARLLRSKGISALALIDLDDFKSVNSRYGHAGGDQVLTHVAHTLEAQLRPSDIAARVGGDEFLVLFPDADPEGAGRACERIRRALTAPKTIRTEDGLASVTISASFGCAALDPEATSIEDGLLATRATLAAAKDQGKNSVVTNRR